MDTLIAAHEHEEGDGLRLAMAVAAADVAAEIRRQVPDLETKRLHKLLYYCQGHHLGWFGRPLFKERVSAWDMGPVVGELWHAEVNGTPQAAAAIVDESLLNTIGYVLSRYGRLSGADLERLTHSEPPWQQADQRRPAGGTEPIPFTSMKTFFPDRVRTRAE